MKFFGLFTLKIFSLLTLVLLNVIVNVNEANNPVCYVEQDFVNVNNDVVDRRSNAVNNVVEILNRNLENNDHHHHHHH